MTVGRIAATRLSRAATVHVVQPRFDAPPTTNLSTMTSPPSGRAQNAVTVSIARTTLFVIGKRSGQVSQAPGRCGSGTQPELDGAAPSLIRRATLGSTK